MNELLGVFGAHRRNVTATVAAWGLVAVVLMAATVVSQMLGGPDLRPVFNGGLCVVGPLVGAALVKRAHRDEQRVLVGASLALLLIGLTLSLGPLIAEMPSGRGALLQLMTREPVAFISSGVAAILIGLMAKVVYEPGEGFKRARAAALGDARWLSMEEAAALFPSDGEVVVGERTRPDREPAGKKPFDPADKSTWGRGGSAPLLTYNLNFDSTHMLFFAGSGGFKTTGTVVPTALRYTGSMVVLDPAREVGQMVAGHRAKMAAGDGTRKVVILDPTASVVQGCDVLEPIANSLTLLTDTAAFARLLTAESPRRGGGSDQFFEMQTLNLMHGLLVYLLASSEFLGNTRLDGLRSLTSLPERALRDKIQEIVGNTGDEDAPGYIPNEEYRQFVRETLGPFVSMADATWTGIASGVAKDTQWLSIPALRSLVCGNTFSVTELPKGALDVFIQVPGDLTKSYPGVVRTLIGSLMTAMGKANGSYAKRVLFVLDEVDLLGYMSILEEARDRGRKYGITLMLLYQSVGQLEKHFGKDGATSWFEGAAFASYAAIKSRETAEQLSKQAGDVTVEVEGRSKSIGMTGLFDKGDKLTQSVSLQRRPLILPHEIREMRADEQIIMVRGHPALRCGRAIFFRRPEMQAVVQKTTFTPKKPAAA